MWSVAGRQVSQLVGQGEPLTGGDRGCGGQDQPGRTGGRREPVELPEGLDGHVDAEVRLDQRRQVGRLLHRGVETAAQSLGQPDALRDPAVALQVPGLEADLLRETETLQGVAQVRQLAGAAERGTGADPVRTGARRRGETGLGARQQPVDGDAALLRNERQLQRREPPAACEGFGQLGLLDADAGPELRLGQACFLDQLSHPFLNTHGNEPKSKLL